METKQITAEMYEALKKPLPSEAVKPHPTKTFLSSIKAIYVTERMNDVFGCGVWQLRTEVESVNNETGFVVCKTILTIPEYNVYLESFGGNNNGGTGSKNFDLGDAFKGATTDGITKIGSYLGIGIDVFKGQQCAVSTPEKTNVKKLPDNPNKELKWLNVMDKENNFTPEWFNIIDGVKNGKIGSVADVRKYYAISREVAAKIETLLNS